MAEHPATPPPELVQQWRAEWRAERLKVGDTNCEQWGYATARAARWGADQELEACIEWLDDTDCEDPQEVAQRLRNTRRPKPPSLNSIALQMLGTIERDAHYIPEITDTIRRALEQLDD